MAIKDVANSMVSAVKAYVEHAVAPIRKDVSMLTETQRGLIERLDRVERAMTERADGKEPQI